MRIITTDKNGRITIGRRLVAKYGKKFFVVPAEGELILIPAGGKSPIKMFEELGKNSGISKFSLKVLKKSATEEAMREAIGG